MIFYPLAVLVLVVSSHNEITDCSGGERSLGLLE